MYPNNSIPIIGMGGRCPIIGIQRLSQYIIGIRRIASPQRLPPAAGERCGVRNEAKPRAVATSKQAAERPQGRLLLKRFH